MCLLWLFRNNNLLVASRHFWVSERQTGKGAVGPPTRLTDAQSGGTTTTTTTTFCYSSSLFNSFQVHRAGIWRWRSPETHESSFALVEFVCLFLRVNKTLVLIKKKGWLEIERAKLRKTSGAAWMGRWTGFFAHHMRPLVLPSFLVVNHFDSYASIWTL